ncbi:uncharacterized protein LOC104908509 isoform X1 [Beta vulgaris subsp. vulgaris]|uniref:uncharacterized protein LOC104908509 isoform X1 n=1 Tax=Beta vulgaris subsp. vulgaris TaxID=3555 RepID=UPI0020376782|nr:uncharacterized protein LOC104908509 isoform X1 [Beta vulgaris subsp. vulgaris]
MMATIPTNHFNLRIHHIQLQPRNSQLVKSIIVNRRRRNSRPPSSFSLKTRLHFHFLNLRNCPCLSVVPKAIGDADASSQHSTASDADVMYRNLSSTDENYVPLLVRMLGLDNDPLDREQAVIALWKYSLGGNRYVDHIMQFRGCVNLTVHLLRSKSSKACEAAAGLLRMIFSVNAYRDIVAESGAIEETSALLRRPSLTSEMKEQSICMLWNLTADEKFRLKIANTALLPLLLKLLDDEDMKVIEAAGGVLANLALSSPNHSIMVEAGVIPRLAKFLTNEIEGSKVVRKEAKNALLELVKDDYYKILVMEEGLVPVPLVGAAAYASYKPALHSWPSLPDGTEFTQSSKGPSRYGASELLLGLNVEDNTEKIDKSKMDAIVGRTQQQFLARIGAIEIEDENNSERGFSTSGHQTLLPWKDGIARLVLVLELEDETAIAKAADSIAASAVNEHMRTSFREAGAVKRLVHLLSHSSNAVRSSVLSALDKLSISNAVCGTMEAEGVTRPLINILNDLQTTESLIEKAVSILARIWDPNKQMKLKFYGGPVNGSTNIIDSSSHNVTPGLDGAKMEVKNLLDSALAARLVDILKITSPSLQTKVASILEYFVMIETCMDTIIATEIGSSLINIFKQIFPDTETCSEDQEPDAVYVEEIGRAVSQASRLLTKLLDFQQFRQTIDSNEFTTLLRQILKSDIHLDYKEWVAACLVRLSFSSSPFENPITTDVTLHETIPRLVEQIRTTFSADAQEAAVVELNWIVSEGVVGAARAVAAHGAIFPLVKLLEQGSERAVEAGLAVLYTLSMDSENHSAILAAGAVPVLRRIILSHKPQWIRALHLLRNLPV